MRTTSRTTVLTAITIVCALGQPHVEAPRLGAMVDARGDVRTVSGVAGSFVAGPVQAHAVVALACAEQVCIAKADASLIVPGGEIDAPPGAAVLAVDGKRAVAYLTSTGEFFGWTVGGRIPSLEPLAWNPLGNGDHVLSILLTATGGEIAVRRDAAVWMVAQDGSNIDTLPAEASGPVLLTGGSAVYSTSAEIVVRRSDGTGARFPVAGVQSLYAMSADWVEIATAGARYALRTVSGRESLYLLPGGAP